MNAEYLIALRASPSFFFVSDELPYAEFSDVLKILNHAHTVLGSIALIQIFQPSTGKAVATEAVLDFSFRHLLAVLDLAQDANLSFEAVVAKAAWAWILVPRVS